jgi:hypothetical protein
MLRVRNVDSKVRNTVNPLHQLKHGYTFNDYRTRRCNPSFDDAIHLVVEMDEVILCRDQKEIGLNQRHIEVPRKVTSKCGLSDTIATIDRDNHTRKPSHNRRQGFHDLQVAWKNSGQGGTYLLKLTTTDRTARKRRRRAVRLSDGLGRNLVIRRCLETNAGEFGRISYVDSAQLRVQPAQYLRKSS